MRLKYSRILKLAGLVLLIIFVVPLFFDNSTKLRSSDIDLERQIDKAFKNQERHIADANNEEPKVADVKRQGEELEETVFKQGIIGNYESTLEPRSGPGENGEGVTLDASEKKKAQRLIAEFGFNMVASDKISLDRRIKDTRPAECKYWHYPTKLPTASVVIVFHNEGWSTLIRTVHSVINTSPPELLADIVLVDDYSNKDHLKEHLDDYVKRWNGKVVVHHTAKREGLVQARQIGAQMIKGDVIIILDAHCECVVNWLPPLLARIKANRKTLAVPLVDGIEWNTLTHNGYGGDTSYVGIWEWGFLYKEMAISKSDFEKKVHKTEPNRKTLAVPVVDKINWNILEHGSVYKSDTLYTGIFEWGFLYKEQKASDRLLGHREHFSQPYWSPTHAGGLLAIEKNWFFELGGYDPGIKIWGAEQYELSFKVWQCGGVVEWVPCSHVAHIYRGPRTESQHPAGANPHQSAINHMRLAHVWMDEYAKYYFIRNPEIQKLDYGDIAPQKAIREKLQCKPFKWFMDNVAYDLLKKFPLPPENKVWGEAVNTQNNVCLDVRGADFGQPIGVSGCHHQLGNQCKNTYHHVCLNQLGANFGQNIGVSGCRIWSGELFLLNVEGQISSGEHCFVSDHDMVKKKFCLDYQGIWNPNGEWKYEADKKHIYSTKEKKCMTTDGKDLKLAECKDTDPSQQWVWREIYF